MNKEVITKINQNGYKAYFTITGGGASFIGSYLSISGGSNFVVGANVPYSQTQFDKLVGKVDFKYCSEEAARKLAVYSFLECVSSGVSRDKAIGIGVTASLVKDNEREGREHKAFICLHSEERTVLRNVNFYQTTTREYQETVVARQILDIVAKQLNINNDGSENLDVGRIEKIVYKVANHLSSVSNCDKCIVFPASFNPFHCGHGEIIKKTKELLGQEPILEISIQNADKGEIDWIEVEKRANQLVYHNYILTYAATFDEKVDYFSKLYYHKPITFVVGVDTWNRIWDVSRYGFNNLMQQWKKWDSLHIKFLVFPRSGINPTFYINNFWDEVIPVVSLMTNINDLKDFNVPVSSTEIRKKNSETA